MMVLQRVKQQLEPRNSVLAFGAVNILLSGQEIPGLYSLKLSLTVSLIMCFNGWTSEARIAQLTSGIHGDFS